MKQNITTDINPLPYDKINPCCKMRDIKIKQKIDIKYNFIIKAPNPLKIMNDIQFQTK